MDVRVLRPKSAANYLGVGLTSLWELVKTGRVPTPIAITGNARGFPVEELDGFVDARKRDRDAEVSHG